MLVLENIKDRKRRCVALSENRLGNDDIAPVGSHPVQILLHDMSLGEFPSEYSFTLENLKRRPTWRVSCH